MGVEQAGVDGDAGGRNGESFVVKEDGNGRGEISCMDVSSQAWKSMRMFDRPLCTRRTVRLEQESESLW